MFFSDETATGINPALRGYARVVIAARWPSTLSVEWIRSLISPAQNDGQEVKSKSILERCETDPLVRRTVDRHVVEATIFVADPFAHLRELLDQIARRLKLKVDPQRELISLLRKEPTSKLAEMILWAGRGDTFINGPVSKIEALLGRAINTVGLRSSPKQLFDRREMLALSDHDVRELIARFSVVLGDVLDPVERMKSAMEQPEDQRFLLPGPIAWRTFERVVTPDYVFDKASAPVLAKLKNAHNMVVESLNGARMIDAQLKAGSVFDEDSRRLLELQAADLAAGLARQIFESNFDDVESAAHRVRARFNRVLFNDRWLGR